MDKKLKEKWIKALRSGRYKQTTGTLFRKNSNTNCCLGVLCRVARFKRGNAGGFFHKKFKNGKGEFFSSFPMQVSTYLGIRSNEGILIRMNDAENKSFSEIADYIEKNI